MPQKCGLLTERVFHGVKRVVIAIAARKNYHSEFHCLPECSC
jgi:hypothetical protein